MAEQGKRFDFGGNWQSFLRVVDDERIGSAEASLRNLLRIELVGKSFLDVGSGSGLSSLAAVRLGATRVHSFDYDPGCVACTLELKQRYASHATQWTIERGDVLDSEYLARLGCFDVVYSWGVLHHTGQMWHALGNVTALVAPGGCLALALYADQGFASRFWLGVKRLYNHDPLSRGLVIATFVPAFFLRGLLLDLIRLRSPAARYREYKSQRGMSRLYDWFDWLGGLPFEVADETDVIEFHRRRGFELARVNRGAGSNRNHEYTFSKVASGTMTNGVQTGGVTEK
jgi:2-polyprenyl-6-hydroxyphenyl methylase/3-demethylubiquinone-9 3-methyltransferase